MWKQIIYLCFISALFSCGSSSNQNDKGSAVVDYPSSAFGSLQEAVNSLSDGDVLNISSGHYEESVNIIDKTVHLQGSMMQTVINGQGGTCITIMNSSGTTISGLALINCDDGISTDSLVTISDNYFFNNIDGVDYEGGGGILENNIFYMNGDDAIDLDYGVEVDINNNIISSSNDDGIEIRLHPYNGETINILIHNNTFKYNKSNGIQLIDYEIDTNRSFEIYQNIFIESGYNEISFSDNEVTIPSYDVGSIAEPVLITNNSFHPETYSFSGEGVNTVFENNTIYSISGDGNINTSTEFSIGTNFFVRLD